MALSANQISSPEAPANHRSTSKYQFEIPSELDLVKDDRAIIDLSSFAYNNNGTLSLTFKEFQLEEDEIKKMIKARDFSSTAISKSGRS